MQVLEKFVSVNNPEQAQEAMQQGLVNILSPQYVKALQSSGINVKKFAPDGKFSGEGGVEGLLKLVYTMRTKGLEDSLKSNQSGFSNDETNQLILALMKHSSAIRGEMIVADQAATSDQLSTNFAEIKQANFGKIKAAEIQIEKFKLSDVARKPASFAGDVAGKMADYPNAALAGGLGLAAGVLLYKNRKKKLGGIVGAAGVQSVFVTNWPIGMAFSGGGQQRQRLLANNSGITTQGGNGNPSRGGSKLNKIGQAAGGAAVLLGALDVGYSVVGPVVRDGIDSLVSAVSGKETTLGAAIYDFFSQRERTHQGCRRGAKRQHRCIGR